jgi:hypothetical protein
MPLNMRTATRPCRLDEVTACPSGVVNDNSCGGAKAVCVTTAAARNTVASILVVTIFLGVWMHRPVAGSPRTGYRIRVARI